MSCTLRHGRGRTNASIPGFDTIGMRGACETHAPQSVKLVTSSLRGIVARSVSIGLPTLVTLHD
jgi:hypothetical protein